MLMYPDKYKIDTLLRKFSTKWFEDTSMQAFIWKMVKLTGDVELIEHTKRTILDNRNKYVAYFFGLQSHWQNCNVNHHSDSFELRESYVAPHLLGDDEYRKKQRKYNKTRKPELFRQFIEFPSQEYNV